MWLYGEALTIAFADEPLARDRVRSQPGKGRPRAVEEPPVYETPSRSPQRALWERDDTEWLQVIRRPDCAPRQASLFMQLRTRVVRMRCLDRRTDVRYIRLGA